MLLSDFAAVLARRCAAAVLGVTVIVAENEKSDRERKYFYKLIREQIAAGARIRRREEDEADVSDVDAARQRPITIYLRPAHALNLQR